MKDTKTKKQAVRAAMMMGLLALSAPAMGEDAQEVAAPATHRATPRDFSGPQAVTVRPSLQAHQQLDGDYTDTGRENLPLGMIQEAWKNGGETAGVYTVAHRENKVIRVIARENTKVMLQLPTFETVKEVVVGNEAILAASPIAHNRLILTPQHFVGVDTNLTVIGESGLVYSFYVQIHGYNSKKIPDFKVIVWSPLKPLPRRRVEEQEKQEEERTTEKIAAQQSQGDFLEKVPFSPEHLTYGFAMAGDKAIAPKRVFTDGWRTFFDFGERMGRSEIPAVFRVVDGIDTQTGAVRKGNLLVVPETGTFALLLGSQRVCVWPTKREV